jgi:hypothetical protein
MNLLPAYTVWVLEAKFYLEKIFALSDMQDANHEIGIKSNGTDMFSVLQ